MPGRNLSRRDFLKLGGLGLAGSWLASCGSPSPLDASLDVPQPIPTRLNPPAQPAASASPTLPPDLPPSPTAAMVEILPSFTENPTATLSPTATLEPLPASTQDVLTEAQKERLAAAALSFVAEDEQAAIQVARSLGYIKNDGHPASVCGPLAAAILREAGLLSRYVDLHEFWLLNPRLSQAILERNFPPDAFTRYQTAQSTAEFDFTAFPLKAGDFIYLFAGDPGSFEHMLVVTRLDEHGRAFTVTNFATPQGYVIQETMLYDPANPGVGKLYDWTNRKYSMLGLTGFGGFLLIRFTAPVADPGPEELSLANKLDAIMEKYGGTWRVFIKEIGGPVLYARQERYVLHPASVIKVPIAMLFFKSLQRSGIRDYTQALQKGIGGRSYKQLLRAMLVNSEEKASDDLEQAILLNRLDQSKVLQSWGAEHTYIGTRQSTAYEMGILFEGLYTGQCVEVQPRKMILDYLAVYSSGDETRLGLIRQHLPQGYLFYNKRGTITDELLVVADTAIVKLPTRYGDNEVIIAAFAYQGTNPTTYTRLETALGELANQVWQYSQNL